ncbi:MAG TPA: response regulator [Spirochaetota bacterium]|nr:response regulator [Spirochaetota bacterium]
MKILLVDDDQESLSALHGQLESDGHQCVSKSNPLEAVAIYTPQEYDCVITDIRMPEMNGIELLKQVRQQDEKARVIIITAYGDLETARAAINNRAYAFFGKPLDLEELLNTLRQMEKELKEQKPTVDKKKLSRLTQKLKKVYSELLTEIKTMEDSADV